MYSKKYIEELRIIHADKTRLKGFGGKMKDLGEFHTYMDKWNPSSVLDYGCGKGTILGKLKEQYPDTGFAGYDPAVVYYANGATEVDCVFSNDVLEHIEPEFIGQVLHHIDTLDNKYIWLRIDTLPARKRLSDGRNAHLIIEDQDWWTEMIQHSIDGIVVYNNVNKKGKLDVAIEK